MSSKEEKQKRKKAEKAIREYKQWELEQRQFLEDFQVMEDYLDALANSLKKSNTSDDAEAGGENDV